MSAGKDNFIWTRENTAALITLYEANECLWNTSIEAYKNKDKRNAATNSICRQLKITKNQLGRKIHNLRNQFNAEMKKIQKRTTDDGTPRPRCRWEHFDSLRFLKNYIAPRPGYYGPTSSGNSNTEVPSYSIEESVVMDLSESNSNTEQNGCVDPINSEEEIVPIEYTEEHLITKEEIHEAEANEQHSKNHDHDSYVHDDMHQSSIQYERVVETHDQHNHTSAGSTSHVEIPVYMAKRMKRSRSIEQDDWDLFGQFVATELRNLNSDKSRKKLKRKIMQVMLDVGSEDDDISINIKLN